MLTRIRVFSNVKRAMKTGWRKEYCLNFVRTMLGIPSNGTPNAYEAALDIPKSDRLAVDETPCFHPLFIRDHNPDGHVVLTAGYFWNPKRGRTDVYSTDVRGSGTVARVPLAEVLRWCGGSVMWGSKSLEGYKVK